MMRCEHNKNGEFMDEQDGTKVGQRCSSEADVLVFAEYADAPKSILLCSEAPEHLMLLDDELSASEIPFRVYQLVDVTEAVHNEQPVQIEIARGSDPDHVQFITWSHEESSPMVARATLAN